MEGEINNFIMVWLSAISSLCYCHTIAKVIPGGNSRLVALFPVICLFLFLPLNLTSFILGGSTAFFISWLANFKLLLFAYGKGPLSNDDHSNISLSKFILIASFPLKISQKLQSHPKSSQKSAINYAAKTLLLAMCICVYDYKDHVHQNLILFLYCFHIYVSLEIILAMIAFMTSATFGMELEPQFDEPYLSTSLQDFWGRRWNLMVPAILRPMVYLPVRSIWSRWIGKKWATLIGVLASFLASGLMHELIFFYIGRVKPTWEVTSFFVLHGVCLAAEIAVKKALLNSKKWRLPRPPPMVSALLAVGFVVVTGFWLFFPPLLRCKADDMARAEVVAFINFLKNVAQIFRLKSSM